MLLPADSADKLVRMLPTGEPIVVLVSGEAVSTGLLTAGSGQSWENELVAALDRPGSPMTVLRRCVDIGDVLAVATTGQAAVAIVSADLRRLDTEAVSAAAGVRGGRRRRRTRPPTTGPASGSSGSGSARSCRRCRHRCVLAAARSAVTELAADPHEPAAGGCPIRGGRCRRGR